MPIPSAKTSVGNRIPCQSDGLAIGCPALKVAPKWVFSQGIEYTTLIGFPTYYFNGSILYRFTSESNLKIFFGQQRGGLKCVSGICKVFPAFSGARVELTLRF